MLDANAGNIVAIMALGMALAFVVVDYRSRASRWLAFFLAGLAMSVWSNANFIRSQPDFFADWTMSVPLWSGLPGLTTAFSIFAGAEWLRHIRRTIPAGHLNTRAGDSWIRIAQVLSVVYAVFSVVMPEWRVRYFLGAANDSQLLWSWQFWMMAVPFLLALFMVVDAALVTLRRKPDQGEQIRLIGVCLATPFLAASLLLPITWASYVMAVGLIILLIAGVQYHVLQGQRGQFMTRFLSPQVAKLVRQTGLSETLDQQTLSLSVVACDLRGFTQYAAAKQSTEVIDFLREYYAYIGSIAAEFNATIKDYAGDGVLLLVGAPVAMHDHATQAVSLACAIRDRRAEILPQNHALGLGVGVASGPVSVGVIGGERLEYAAVGAAVNLASRLCDHAANGEVRIAAETAADLSSVPCDYTVAEAEPAMLKGLSQPVANFLALPRSPSLSPSSHIEKVA